jgi:GntR family transcriptional regulator
MRIDLDATRGGVPLYLQLANALADVITLEQLRPGDQLPSENTLAADNRLSRATVIKAFDTLVERGLVTRRQGKGTFVNSRPMERELPELTGFSEHVHGLGQTPGASLLSYDTWAAGDPERPSSSFADDEPLVGIERLRTVEGAPVGLHRTLLPADVVEAVGLDERTAAGERFSLYAALRAAGVHLSSGDETFRAINGDGRDAELLGVEEGTALIEIVRNSRDVDGRLVEVVRARYLGSHYLYRIAFAPTPPGGSHESSHSTAFRTGGGLAADPDRLR